MICRFNVTIYVKRTASLNREAFFCLIPTSPEREGHLRTNLAFRKACGNEVSFRGFGGAFLTFANA